MKTWTVPEMLAERPCSPYDESRLMELGAGQPSLSLLDILQLAIPARDRVWTACRPGALDKKMLDAWLERTVTRAVTNHALHCGLPAVEAWAAGWLSGEDRSAESALAAREAAEAAWAVAEAAWAAAEAAREAAEAAKAAQAAEAAWAWAKAAAAKATEAARAKAWAAAWAAARAAREAEAAGAWAKAAAAKATEAAREAEYELQAADLISLLQGV